MTIRLSDEDKKTMKYFEAELKKLKTSSEAMFSPSKEDEKYEREIVKLGKEITSLQSENEKEIQRTLRESAKGIKKAEKILKKDPGNKEVIKSLKGLCKIRNNLIEIQNR